jgi:hypothetical protein
MWIGICGQTHRHKLTSNWHSFNDIGLINIGIILYVKMNHKSVLSETVCKMDLSRRDMVSPCTLVYTGQIYIIRFTACTHCSQMVWANRGTAVHWYRSSTLVTRSAAVLIFLLCWSRSAGGDGCGRLWSLEGTGHRNFMMPLSTLIIIVFGFFILIRHFYLSLLYIFGLLSNL